MVSICRGRFARFGFAAVSFALSGLENRIRGSGSAGDVPNRTMLAAQIGSNSPSSNSGLDQFVAPSGLIENTLRFFVDSLRMLSSTRLSASCTAIDSLGLGISSELFTMIAPRSHVLPWSSL